MKKSNETLVPIRKLMSAKRITSSGLTPSSECWAAETLDQEWSFERLEESGTPWAIYHNLSVADQSYTFPVVLVGTLRKCRVYVTCGWAAWQLEQCKAEAVS